MDFEAIGLPQPDDQNAKVCDGAKLREAAISRYKKAAIGQGDRPKVWVLQSPIWRPAYVPHVMTKRTQAVHGHSWNVFVDQNPHPSVGCGRDGGNLLLSQVGRIVERCEYVLTCERWILGQ